MKYLTEYKKNKYVFQLVEREGDVAIFRGVSDTCSAPNWEVIKIQSHNGRTVFDKYFEPAEYPPSDNEWGVKGFTALDKAHATEIFERLCENVNQ